MDELDEQLAMIHIGIIVKHFIPDEVIPDTLDDVTELIRDELGVKIERGDSIIGLRNKIMDAYIDQYGDDAVAKNKTDAFDDAMKGI